MDFRRTVGLLLATAAAAQTAPDFDEVATFVLDGERRVLSRQMVALELARTYLLRPLGADALNHLIDLKLVELAATRQKLMPSRDELKGRVKVIEAGLLERKQDLDELLRSRRLTRATFEKQLALGVAKERLVAQALGETQRTPTPAELQLWSKQARNKATVILDRAVLPAGVLARVDGAEITAGDLGDVLFIKSDLKALTVAVKDLAYRAIVKRLAKKQDVRVTDEDVDAYVRIQQRRHEADSQRGKLPFANIVKATTGLTIEQYKREPALRAKVLFQNLVKKKYPPARLEELYQADKQNILKRHGARRSFSVLLVRATDRPNQLVKLDPKAASKRIEELKTDIRKKKQTFPDIARIHSEGPNKKQGGAIGWCHQEQPKAPVPKEVLRKAFEAKALEVAGPVRTEEGFWLVWVTGTEPEPADDLVLKRLRKQLAQDYVEELYKSADIQMKVR